MLLHSLSLGFLNYTMKGMDYIGNFKPGFFRTPGFLGNTTGLVGVGKDIPEAEGETLSLLLQ